jgi:hypothetical protein
MKKFIHRSLENGRNIIISTEWFATISVEDMMLLKHLLNGFDVTILHMYREWLSHLVSAHFERNRFTKPNKGSQPFSSFLLETMDQITEDTGFVHWLSTSMVVQYARVFGRENVTVIDMAGSKTADVPIEKIVLCEVMHIMCAREDLFAASQPLNVHSDLVVVVLHSLFLGHVGAKGSSGKCHFCAKRDSGLTFITDVYTRTLLHGGAGGKNALPTQISHLALLVPHSMKEDSQLRTALGDRILHGNQTANILDMEQHVFVEELDVQAFGSNVKWLRWMDEQYEAAHKAGLLCAC